MIYQPDLRRYFTSSKCPSCAASMSGVLQPNSISAPALIRKSATSKNPPQHANVRLVSCVSSVCAFMSASLQNQIKYIHKPCPKYQILSLKVTFLHIYTYTYTLYNVVTMWPSM